MSDMPFYTFIMNYAGGTYISQVRAPSETSACVKWAQRLEVSQIQGLGPKGQESLIEQVKDDPPGPLDGTLNAWCTDAIIHGKFALINLVQTDRTKATRRSASKGRASA
jgi:hypothetical protein